ncbi:hypothetical protein GH714_007378 [Hevea brasiliensis]|uniref:Uncharacterized protein n=1 Tax=Hevea brasiliensis TaxID=3981 RepID=A0A6A6KDY2_HEVBR|nr:hypothetical protein GH714_007378 [Hevea brasiliensis]
MCRFKEKRWDSRRMLGSGGMPSSHTATVTALAVAIGLQEGTGAPTFAIALVLACVVMYDATGVRLHAGRQAELLNQIVCELPPDHPVSNVRPLRDSLGHTPLQKIDQKNTWELKLIDHLSDIIKVASEADTETDFQKASYTLEAGVKIYSVRVDAVLSEAYKVLDELGRASLEGEPETSVTKSDNVKVWQDRSHFKKNSGKKVNIMQLSYADLPLSTLESSFEALNVKRFDGKCKSYMSFATFTSAQFDEGGAKGLLLNNLGVYGGCQMEKNILAKNEISPTLADIICHFDEDNQRSSETFGVGQKFDARANVFGTSEVKKDNSFGNFEAWAYNNDNESIIFNESFPNDSTLQSDHEGFFMLFSTDWELLQKQNMQARPDHWKFQKYRCQENVSFAESGYTTKRHKSKYQAEDDIDFIKSLNRKRVDIFAPPKSLKSLLLPAKQAPCSSTLPEDCQYQSENLVKLFLLPNVTGHSLDPGLRLWSSPCGKVSSWSADNAAGVRFVQKNKSGQERNDFDEASPSCGNEHVLGSQGVEDANELVTHPRKVNKIEVQYDKTSKEVDVQALKEMLWDHIQESFGILGREKEKVPTVDKLDRVSVDNNALREDLRSFVSKFVREKGKEVYTEGIGVRGAESSGLLIFPKDPANPQMKDQSNIDNIATVEEFLSAESITLGTDEDMIDHQGKFKQKIEKETEEFLEDDCGMFSQIQEAIYIDFGIKDVHE